ncbi:MAG TPA: hypothetical protein VEJ20_08890, partial [Candidatus Eremiobacteraceae bacterium]|nr:hypothetical protein [Candidatus Eremiobacteraceae bacterium]
MTTILKPEDFATLPLVQGAALAPRGDRVAFAVSTMDLEADRYRADLYVASLDGTWVRRCTNGEARDAQPRWSPD